jgi:hypothetical protein|tara:strand:- start:319 stop:642 length:324 start_codon:yes stop_codon:yes gene_type:complete
MVEGTVEMMVIRMAVTMADVTVPGMAETMDPGTVEKTEPRSVPTTRVVRELTQRTPSVGILEPVISVLLLARMDASPVGLALVFARMEKRRKQPSRFREPFASPISP